VEQSHLLMSSLELWTKKATERCSGEACDHLSSEVKQLQTEWDAVKCRVAEEKARLESRRVQLADTDDAVKRELTWIQDVEQYFADAGELCVDLAEKKSRLQRTKADNVYFSYKFSWCIVYVCIVFVILECQVAV